MRIYLNYRTQGSQCGKLPNFNCGNLNFLSLPQGSESPMMIGELRSDLDDVDP